MLQFSPTTDTEPSENKSSLKNNLENPHRRSAFQAPKKRVPLPPRHTHNRPSCDIFSGQNEQPSQEKKGAKEKAKEKMEWVENDENLFPKLTNQVPDIQKPKAIPATLKRLLVEPEMESIFNTAVVSYTPSFSNLAIPALRPETPSFGMSQLSLDAEPRVKKKTKLGGKEK